MFAVDYTLVAGWVDGFGVLDGLCVFLEVEACSVMFL
jgi:hypothetical protein